MARLRCTGIGRSNQSKGNNMTGYQSKKTAARDKLEALAQPAQEPDEWLTGCPECGMDNGCDCGSGTWNPPQPAQEPPPWWPAVENILTEYGLQAIDFVADFKEAMKDAPQRPLVGLTDDDWKEIEDMPDAFDQGVAWCLATLKRKNA